ncbi:hypothetical protein OG874_21610 [Nocardia sp. NBC_00565]|uniref:hypothetical protein n=1 Tax=Nocardia sp. NBC_00565 TaxID=2975993 RepID=UPI002E8118A2|nr:hypothetical protein [Nocardia sp. NBC_00565]WUC07523.1 hypothetical protein OG874_21610 [Nocardia sp. NBC_00565]
MTSSTEKTGSAWKMFQDPHFAEVMENADVAKLVADPKGYLQSKGIDIPSGATVTAEELTERGHVSPTRICVIYGKVKVCHD